MVKMKQPYSRMSTEWALHHPPLSFMGENGNILAACGNVPVPQNHHPPLPNPPPLPDPTTKHLTPPPPTSP